MESVTSTTAAPRCAREAPITHDAPAVDRLTPADLMLIWPEEEGWPQDIGAIAVLDGRRLLDAHGRFRLDAAREHIERRAHRLARFHQLLHWPGFGFGWPLWVEASSFDVTDHVGMLAIAAPGDDAQLLLACEELRRRGLNRARPLWEMWFLPGLPEGRIGFYMRMHHAIADGVAGIAALGAFLDLAPAPVEPEPEPWSPCPTPSARDLFVDNVRRRVRGFTRIVSAIASPITTSRRLRRVWPAVREIFAEGRAPRTSVNRRIGSDRSMAIVRADLEQIKAIAHAQDAKTNDVVLTAVSRGYAELFRSRGEAVDNCVLRAFVPVSQHQEAPDQAKGNVDAGMVVPLPLGERDDVRRLRTIAADTAERKQKIRPNAGTLFSSVLVQRAFLRTMPRQRFMNAYVANVPGPPVPLYFAGAPVLELFPVVPITANVSIGVGALSYAGRLNITVVADEQLCPDLDVFVDGIRHSLDALGISVLPAAEPT
jgi:diacylglycerol O-acyltransferase / wax synthase